MDTGKPALGKRVLSSFFALTLVMGLVPVSAYAEVGKAQEQQGQEQSEQPVAASDENASQDAASNATQQGGASSGSKDEAASGSASGTKTGVAETPKASGSVSGSEKAADNTASTSNGEAATQSADNGVAVQAAQKDVVYRYSGDTTLTKGIIYSQLTSNFDYYSRYMVDGTEVSVDWGTTKKNDPFLPIVESEKYIVKGGTWIWTWKYTEIGTLTLQKTWKAVFSSNIPEGGIEVVNPSASVQFDTANNTVIADDGTTVKFKVKDVNGKKATVTRVVGSESVELKADSDGAYSFASDKNSTIKVDYAVSNATLTANFDNASVSIDRIGGSLTSGAPVDVPAGYENTATIKPEGNYAITSAVLVDDKGNKQELVSDSSFSSKDTRAAVVSIPALDAGVSYTLIVTTAEGKLALKKNHTAAVKTVDSSEYYDCVIAGVIDSGSSVPPSMTRDDLKIEYNTGYVWLDIKSKPIVGHKFGSNNNETIRITYKGNNQYSKLDYVETTIDIVKTPTEMVVDPASVSVPFGTTGADLKAEILKNMTVKDAVSGKAIDVADSDIAIEGYDSQKAGEQTVSASYNGSDSYDSC